MRTQISPNPIETADEESVDLLELLALFLAQWKIGLLVAAIVFLIGVAYTYHQRPEFEATAVVLPRQSAAESNSLSAIFSGKRQADVYVGLLLSRGVLDDVVQRLGLMRQFGTTSHEAARDVLAASTKVTLGADSLLTIRVRDRDAQEAMKIANAYIDALQAQQESMAMSQSTQQRHFFERQLDEEKAALAAAELDLRKTQESSGVVQVETQTQIGLSAIAGARAQITSLQVQLAALLQSATEENPQVKTLRSQIAQLQAQERTLESGSASRGAGAAAPAGRMPELNLEYQRKVREVKYHEALFNSLSNQFEAVRLSEAATVNAVQVVDRAVAPERRAWPPRQMYLAVSAAVSVLAGLVAITAVLFWRRLGSDASNREHLRTIRRNFHLGR